MARTEHLIRAEPQKVFDVLSDPRSYGYWVVGSKEIRASDPDWPRPGTRFHHTVGIGPLTIRDHTEVERCEPGRLLQLKAKIRPLGTARVRLELEARDGGTHVTMIEDPGDPFTGVIFNPLLHLLMRGRNQVSLERLAELAEGRRPTPS